MGHSLMIMGTKEVPHALEGRGARPHRNAHEVRQSR
jgi:hypothetical protein